uniref:Cytochrome c oxidase subunit 3 n=1 Tax=Liposcelis paeta TaxID=209927 RepID=A0A096X711_9NEOP|nr:cytochrome c oxidase subunit III [Liposcelis paeta]
MKDKNKFFYFHLVDPSPWPVYISLLILSLMISLYNFMQTQYWNMMNLTILLVFLFTFSFWSRDILRESTFQGNHTLKVLNLLKFGLILFIISEIMFFLSFFWTFFHSSFNPNLELGNSWPSWGIQAINPFGIPLLNTLILISSGVSITYSHHMMLNFNFNLSLVWVFITILLGLYFTFLQFLEYKFSSFSIMDSVYGSIFFMSTGFHGLHVIIGTSLILFSLSRMMMNHFSYSHHLMFEFACWYWHFVDLIWLFLFIFIYWWGF